MKAWSLGIFVVPKIHISVENPRSTKAITDEKSTSSLTILLTTTDSFQTTS
jgi:hypothetical protein